MKRQGIPAVYVERPIASRFSNSIVGHPAPTNKPTDPAKFFRPHGPTRGPTSAIAHRGRALRPLPDNHPRMFIEMMGLSEPHHFSLLVVGSE
jgi:hypothetical protein